MHMLHTVCFCEICLLVGKLGVLESHCRDKGPNDEIWKKLWGLDIVPKMKHFTWRACNSLLAVDAILQRRHITDDSLQHMPTGGENHLPCYFQMCACWDNNEFSEILRERDDSSFTDLVFHVANKRGRYKLGLGSVFMYGVGSLGVQR